METNTLAPCPWCGSKEHELAHRINSNGQEIEQDLQEVQKVMKDLNKKYPNVFGYCPICGAKM